MPGPLDGMRVVDITQGIAGPYCSMALGDAGAQVTKVEPLEGDCSRGYGPPFIGNESAVFLSLNRNKRSMALDICREEGHPVLTRLIENADVFLADLTPAEIEQAGLQYADLRRLNPRLVYCHITPFGEQGPMADLPGAELVVQAMADYPNSLGAIGEPPVRLGTDVANINTGGIALQGIATALFQRERSGTGQKVSVSMLGSLLHMRGMMWAAQSEGVDDWWGFHQDTYIKPPDHGYTTKDGQIFFNVSGIGEDGFAQLVRRFGILDVIQHDPRWANAGRDVGSLSSRYGWEVKAVWEDALKEMASEEAIALIKSVGGVAVPINSYEPLFAHPQVQEIGMLREMEHPSAGRIQMTGIPWQFSDTPAEIQSPPPALGQHTDEILSDLGYDQPAIRQLRAKHVIA